MNTEKLMQHKFYGSVRQITKRNGSTELEDDLLEHCVDYYEKGVLTSDLVGECNLDMHDVNEILYALRTHLPYVEQKAPYQWHTRKP